MTTSFHVSKANGGLQVVKAERIGSDYYLDLKDMGAAVGYGGNIVSLAKKTVPTTYRMRLCLNGTGQKSWALKMVDGFAHLLPAVKSRKVIERIDVALKEIGDIIRDEDKPKMTEVTINGRPVRKLNHGSDSGLMVKDIIAAYGFGNVGVIRHAFLAGLNVKMVPVKVAAGRGKLASTTMMAHIIEQEDADILIKRLEIKNPFWEKSVIGPEVVEPEVVEFPVEKEVVEPEVVDMPVISKDLVPFNFSFKGNPVRTHVEEDGTVMFHGGDICRILGYSESDKAIKRHCKHSKLLRTDETSGLKLNPRGEYFIPESDIYRLTLRSNMPYAGEFQDWICEEVVPTLRRTGCYQIGAPVAQVPFAEEFRNTLMTLLSVNTTAVAEHIGTIIISTTSAISDQIKVIRSDISSLNKKIDEMTIKAPSVPALVPVEKSAGLELPPLRKRIFSLVVSGNTGYMSSIAERWLLFYEQLSRASGISISGEAEKARKKPMQYIEDAGLLGLGYSIAQKLFTCVPRGYRPLR